LTFMGWTTSIDSSIDKRLQARDMAMPRGIWHSSGTFRGKREAK
jgi:hypothetical protein